MIEDHLKSILFCIQDIKIELDRKQNNISQEIRYLLDDIESQTNLIIQFTNS